MSDIITIERMRALVRKGLGNLTSDDISDDEVDELLNFSLWELSEKFPFKEKECLITHPTTEGIREYGLPNFLDAIRTVAIQDEEGLWHKMRKMTPQYLNNKGLDDTDNEDARDLPTQWMRRDSTLVVDPIPDSDEYIIRIEIWRVVPTLVDGTVETIGLPRNWQLMVIEGAITIGLNIYKMDYNLSRQVDAFRDKKIAEAVLDVVKEDGSEREGGLQVRWDWPVREDER